MKHDIITVTTEYLSPEELAYRLRAMAVLDIVMNSEKDAWLRLAQKYSSEKEAYRIGGDLDIFFEENGVFIRGYDHENDLNQFSSDTWDESFFADTYAGVPKNFLDIYKDEEEKFYMTFCMWYNYKETCWKQNITVGNDGGKDYLLDYICDDAEDWIEWAKDYYETEFNFNIVEKVYKGGRLTEEEIYQLNPERDAKAALAEILANHL